MHAAAPATPTLKELTNELKQVADWYLLGINLNLKHHQLRTIRKDHYGDNQCKIEMLGCWLDSTTNPTWETVAEALHLMDEHKIADTMQRKYITSTTTTSTEGTVFFRWFLSWLLHK